MKITNKQESAQMIDRLGLNKLPEAIFHKGEEEEVKKFIQKYPFKYYAIRDREKSGGVFKLAVERNKILDEIKGYNLFSLNVCTINFPSAQICTGDIKISKSGDVVCNYITDPNASQRDAYGKNGTKLSTNLFDKRALDKIPDFDYILWYIDKHDLYDVIVEFALFNRPMGINNEKICIFELRTDY